MKLFSLTTVSLLFSLFLVAQVPPSLKIGAAIPTYNVAMQNATGNDAVTLQSAMGKNGLLVMFSCNTCPFVLKNQQLTKKTIYHANANNIGMIIVNSNEAKRDGDDSYKDMKKYASAQGYTVPYVMDNKSVLADLFGATHTPEVYLFNNKGKLVYKGAMNDNPAEPDEAKTTFIFDALEALAAGKAISPTETKSVGCSIKRKS